MHTRIFTDYRNKLRSVKEISQLSHQPQITIYQRYMRGIHGEALGAPATEKAKQFPWPDGHTYTITELSQKYNISPSTIQSRHYRGLQGLDLIRPAHYQTHTAS